MSCPTLLPGLRPLWRDAHHIQLGTDPERAVILELAVPELAQVLALLDGSRTEDRVLREAAGLGVPPQAGSELLASLCRAGLVVGAHTVLPRTLPEPVRRHLGGELAGLALRRDHPDELPTPAQALHRRAAARVLVQGWPRFATPIVTTLTDAGIGQVTQDGPAVMPRTGRPTFLVQVGQLQPARLAALTAARRRVPVLTVDVRDGVVVTGPLVPPSGSPFLGCLDLHRTDRDAAWPRLAAQLATAPDAPLCTATTLLAAAAFAAHQVLCWVDGRRAETVGATVEISEPGRTRRRSWPPHPRCDCARLVRRQHQRDG
jgi:hypothetical protein